MRTLLRALAPLLLLAGGSAASAEPIARAPTDVQGEWRNARNTVHIRTYNCGNQICGAVSWAAPKAEADAARGGTTRLKGTQVFREFRPAGDGGYKGRVFVPDLNRTFAGKLRVADNGATLVGKGCVLGGLICKTTTWLRVS